MRPCTRVLGPRRASLRTAGGASRQLYVSVLNLAHVRIPLTELRELSRPACVTTAASNRWAPKRRPGTEAPGRSRSRDNRRPAPGTLLACAA
jgi:hypothetical protein